MTPINHYEGDRPKEAVLYNIQAGDKVLIQDNYKSRNEIAFYSFESLPLCLDSTVAVWREKRIPGFITALAALAKALESPKQSKPQ